MPVIPFWLKIVGPLVIFALLVAGVMAWGNSKYRAGHDDGVTQTDAKWQAASDKLKAEAAKSATRADDAAVRRLDEHVEQAQEDQEKVNEAQRNGTSPLDALFGG
jgi:FtsZ-interacting cell division protein ZipA